MKITKEGIFITFLIVITLIICAVAFSVVSDNSNSKSNKKEGRILEQKEVVEVVTAEDLFKLDLVYSYNFFR